MPNVKLKLSDQLPLTCSRAGTCCHGNKVSLNPWELNRLAAAKDLKPIEFRDLHTAFGGTQLKFEGKADYRNKKACNLYIEGFGCSSHEDRPLACRLFPLGRQVQYQEVHYIHEGKTFPCLNGCAEVVNLPFLNVSDYLKGQKTATFEVAQDAYLDLMQNIADIAFELLLDTGLTASGDKNTLIGWQKLGTMSASQLANEMGSKWLNMITTPPLSKNENPPMEFIHSHNELLQLSIQEKMRGVSTLNEIGQASVLVMNIALFLAHCIGADAKGLADYWCETAKEFGAAE